MSSWVVALRVARREAWRAKGRSALVLAMVALPVLGVTAIDVVARTYQLNPQQKATRTLGAADLALFDTGSTMAEQTNGEGWGGRSGPARTGPYDVRSVLPPGSRTVVDRTGSGTVTLGGSVARADLRELAYADPIAAGIYRQATGRAPTTATEAALTTGLAGRLGAHAGDVAQLPAGPVLVVGTVHDDSKRDALTALVGPGGLPHAETTRVLADLPAPPTWRLVRTANAAGVLVTTRGVRLPGQPATTSPGASTGPGTLTSIALVAGMALLEVILLAGPAFAVGAKRQERMLALLAVTGADRRDVGRTVLAGGLVLGVVSGVVGALGGLGAAAVALPLLAPLRADLPGPFDVHLPEIVAVAAVGALTALLAALLPAVNASRQDVLAGLTGRRGVRRTTLHVPVLGLLATVGGTLLALHGARSRSVNIILAGAAIAELGLVATTPALVGLAGRLGPLLTTAPRLALRDAARNRSRTAPAVAAVLAAVAGSVAVSTYVASLDRNDREGYSAAAATGTTIVMLDAGRPGRLPAVSRAVARVLPDSRSTTVSTLVNNGASSYVEVLVPMEQQCPPVSQRRHPADSRCAETHVRSTAGDGLPVGGPALARALNGVTDPAVLAVLDRGGVLVPVRSLQPDGTAVLVVHPEGDADGTRGVPFTLPAAALPPGALQQPVLSAAGARTIGRSVTPDGLAVTGPPPSATQEDRVRAAVLAVAPAAQVVVERGYRSAYGIGLLALLIGSALLVLGASWTATGLAAADGRADLSTLAAVGASPGLRRRLAAAQSVVTAGLGTVLGTVAGLVPAIGLIRAVNAPDSTGYQRPVPFPLVLPWVSIAVTVVAVPLLAGLLAALVTRSRLPLVRRIA